MQLDVYAVSLDVNALDHEPNDAGLLGWKELIPERVERLQRVAYVGFDRLRDLVLRGLQFATFGGGDGRRPVAGRFCVATSARTAAAAVSGERSISRSVVASTGIV